MRIGGESLVGSRVRRVLLLAGLVSGDAHGYPAITAPLRRGEGGMMDKAIIWARRGFGAALVTLGFAFAGSPAALAAPPPACSHGADATAFNKGFNTGYNKGFNTGFNRGYDRGFQVGFRAGFRAASRMVSPAITTSQCYNMGYNAGFNSGFSRGFNVGFVKGFDRGFNRGFRARHHHHHHG